jgi:SAM-dependent methyltransferase
MARQAEARLGRPVRVMRFDGLVAMEAYDAIWAHACLLHAPRSTLSDVLNAIFRALKPGGLHVATFKAGGVEGRDALGRYFNYLSAAWEILAIQGYQGGDYQGGARPWIAITVRKPS